MKFAERVQDAEFLGQAPPENLPEATHLNGKPSTSSALVRLMLSLSKNSDHPPFSAALQVGNGGLLRALHPQSLANH